MKKMDNNKRLTPEEILTPFEKTATTGFGKYQIIDKHNAIIAMQQYAAQEGAAERITIDELSRQVNEFREENERQRSMFLEKSKALSATLDERDNARIWIKSLQEERNEKDALLKEAISLIKDLHDEYYIVGDQLDMRTRSFLNKIKTTGKEAGTK